MPNDLTLLFYLEQSKLEAARGAEWVMFAPRLAIELLEEVLATRQHIDALALKTSLSIADHNGGTQKS